MGVNAGVHAVSCVDAEPFGERGRWRICAQGLVRPFGGRTAGQYFHDQARLLAREVAGPEACHSAPSEICDLLIVNCYSSSAICTLFTAYSLLFTLYYSLFTAQCFHTPHLLFSPRTAILLRSLDAIYADDTMCCVPDKQRRDIA
jgi:hypothetical protein